MRMTGWLSKTGAQNRSMNAMGISRHLAVSWCLLSADNHPLRGLLAATALALLLAVWVGSQGRRAVAPSTSAFTFSMATRVLPKVEIETTIPLASATHPVVAGRSCFPDGGVMSSQDTRPKSFFSSVQPWALRTAKLSLSLAVKASRETP